MDWVVASLVNAPKNLIAGLRWTDEHEDDFGFGGLVSLQEKRQGVSAKTPHSYWNKPTL
jgi:hypothetical protein